MGEPMPEFKVKLVRECIVTDSESKETTFLHVAYVILKTEKLEKDDLLYSTNEVPLKKEKHVHGNWVITEAEEIKKEG